MNKNVSIESQMDGAGGIVITRFGFNGRNSKNIIIFQT